MNSIRQLTTEPLQHFVRGVCMGAADVVPGVSGGTVALVLGIYTRLIQAVSRFGPQWLMFIRKRQWKEAWLHIDGPLLFPLGFGIVSGILLTSVTVHQLLSSDATRPYTLAVFFGMIAASGYLVLRSTSEFSGRYDLACVAAGLMAFVLALVLALVVPSHEGGSTEPPLWFVFIGGAIGICAMILPGISGAMILLMIGLYGHLTGIPDALKEGDDIGGNLTMLVVFALGCGTGLLTFSRLLNWLLKNHGRVAMVALCGLMFGSLPRLWPYQLDRTPEVADFEDKTLEPIWPANLDLETILIAGTMLGTIALLLTIHFFVQRRSSFAHKAVAA